jgi:nitrate reductase molybdenum cofactor assembly chaperone NarJ/NarW
MTNIYDALAAVLSYPAEDYLARVDVAVLAAPSAIEPTLQEVARELAGKSTVELQELFTVTFDLNPVCSLELGWHIFGENYDRGLLLAKLRALLRAHRIVESGELPDHLAHALRLIACMQPEEQHDFAAAIVLPALGKMLDAIRGKQNPYEKVLGAIKTQLRSLCPEVVIFIPQQEPVLRVLD